MTLSFHDMSSGGVRFSLINLIHYIEIGMKMSKYGKARVLIMLTAVTKR